MNVACGPIPARIGPVIAPVPEPNSTTTPADRRSTAEIMAPASLRELGATAPIIFGWRTKAEIKCQASPANDGRLRRATDVKSTAPASVSVIEYDRSEEHTSELQSLR